MGICSDFHRFEMTMPTSARLNLKHLWMANIQLQENSLSSVDAANITCPDR
jgi:hypothetical protein